jgi:hypothetical protein
LINSNIIFQEAKFVCITFRTFFLSQVLKNIRGPDDEEWLPDGSLGRKERKKNNETLLLVKKTWKKQKENKDE